ncbi:MULTISPECIES: calcium-binding protein, partial [unclassified Phaeobacter]
NILGKDASITNIEVIDVNGKSLFVEGGGFYDFRSMTFVNTTGNIHITDSLGAHVLGSVGHNLITGNIYAPGGNDTISGWGGNDTIDGLHGDDQLHGDAGNDTVMGSAGNDTLFGGADDDSLTGGDDNDDMYGGTGNDTVRGDAGADGVRGEDGDDLIDGGAGRDTVLGGAGNDTISHNAQSGEILQDVMDGGAGIDTLVFDNGSWTNNILGKDASITNIEVIDVNGKSLFVEGGGFYDFQSMTFVNTTGNIHITDSLGAHVLGSVGHNLITGNIYAPGGNDTISGWGGNDTIDGLHGDDQLHGDAGDDHLHGGQGNDALYGGAGADTFVFSEGNDTVHDFGDNTDQIGFEAQFVGMSVNDVLSYGTELATSVFFDFGNGNTLEVLGTNSLSAVSDDIFVF